MKRAFSIGVLAAAAAATGCSSQAGGTADGGVAQQEAGGYTSCSFGVDGGTCVLAAQGKVTDLAGAPLGGLLMTLCGNACFGAQSNDGGAYFIPVGVTLDTENYAIHADGRPDHAVDYLRLHHAEPSTIDVTMRVARLPPSNVLLPPDEAGAPSTVTVGDLTLAVAAGTTFVLDPEDGERGDVGRVFRVAYVPLASAPAYAAAAHLAAIYVIAPSGAQASAKMGVVLKNTAGLPASSAVDIMVLGDDYFSVPPSVGLLSVQAAAHVSADGTTIQTDPGEGIVKLTWLGVRKQGG